MVVWDTNGRNVNGPISNIASASMLFREHAAPNISENNGNEQSQPQVPENNGNEQSQPQVLVDMTTKSVDTGKQTTAVTESNNKVMGKLDGSSPFVKVADEKNKIADEVVVVVSVGSTLFVTASIVTILLCMRKRFHDEGRPIWLRAGTPFYRRTMSQVTGRRSSFPLRFPRFFPHVNSSRQYYLKEMEGRVPRNLHRERARRISIYDTLP